MVILVILHQGCRTRRNNSLRLDNRAAVDLLKLFLYITDYILRHPVEYARNTVLSEIAQFTAGNLSYDNDSTECGVLSLGT